MERTHDYRQAKRRRGHDIGFDTQDGGMTLRAHGWGYADREGKDGNRSLWIVVGDFLLLSHKGGGDTRYRVEKIEYQSDPKDMWFATLTFAPRESQAEAAFKAAHDGLSSVQERK